MIEIEIVLCNKIHEYIEYNAQMFRLWTLALGNTFGWMMTEDLLDSDWLSMMTEPPDWLITILQNM